MGKRNRGAFREPQVAKLERKGATSANDAEAIQRKSTRDVPFRKLNSADSAGRDVRADLQATRFHSARQSRGTAIRWRVPTGVQGKWRALRKRSISRHHSGALPPWSQRTHKRPRHRVPCHPEERMNDRPSRWERFLDDLLIPYGSNADAHVCGSTCEPGRTLQNRPEILPLSRAIERGRGVRSSLRPCDKTRTWPPSAPQRFDPR
jgi:hypothetical protein